MYWFIGQLYSYYPEAPDGRVKYVAHRASCFTEKSEIVGENFFQL